jgi:hypothetical protein
MYFLSSIMSSRTPGWRHLLWTLWDPQHLTTLQASTACHGVRVTSPLLYYYTVMEYGGMAILLQVLDSGNKWK